MSATTRVNGTQAAVATLYSVAQLKAFLIDAGGDISAKTGVDSAIEALIREVQPLMYLIPNAASGLVHVIVDGHAVDAASLQARIVALGTVDSYSFASATVTLGTSVVVS
jgi:hypothetical protein